MRAYIELSADGTIVHASSEAAALVRSDPASLVGRREAELLPAEDAQAVLGLEESGCDRFDLSYRKACASGSDGSGEYVQLRACRIRLSGGGFEKSMHRTLGFALGPSLQSLVGETTSRVKPPW